MREKNIRRAAHALYAAQADDKNAILGSRVEDKEVRTLIKDQGRALTILEKIILPYGQNSFDEDQMYDLLFRKLKKKGHRIQDDETPDDEQYAAEKKAYMDERTAKVPTLLGLSLADLPQDEEQPATEFTLAGDPVPVHEEAPVIEEVSEVFDWSDFYIDDAPFKGESLFADQLAEAVRVEVDVDKIFFGVSVGLVTLSLLLRSQED